MGEDIINTVSFSSDSDDSIFSSSSDLTEEEGDTAASIGPLYELSSLMDQLPIKRGLSKYYQGKSQSFTSLSYVSCLEDLPKKEIPYKKKMKPSKSYGGGLDLSHKSLSYSLGPCSKAYINKKSLRRSSGNLLSCSKPPHVPVHNKNL
ncbi:hypothetical protein J5N97_025884 [Dioscorea zingiberensis]|uniref:Oxidative stress 3 n=1 Tax=Dioscorea zingiberensis TaxID=325984 RepID=A0A9D5C138_9LILI|nr:hypothetical protein J5N97_025884 [Dioscorea zingiberensis]